MKPTTARSCAFAGFAIGCALLASCHSPWTSLASPLRPDATHDDKLAVYATRVIDARTGMPLPDARLVLVPMERDAAERTLRRDTIVCADDLGFVRVSSDDLRGSQWFRHAVIEADHHGPIARALRDLPPVVALEPACDWPIDVRDVFDRPIAGAEVGLSLANSGGHVRVATTDAMGRATLAAVEPTAFGDDLADAVRALHVRAEGFESASVRATFLPGEPPTRIRLQPSASLRGRVLAPNGEPMAGVLVNGEERTDADGAFVLPTFGPGDGVSIQLTTRSREHTFRPAATATRCDLVLPRAGATRAKELATLRIVVRDAATRQPLANAHVQAWCSGWLPSEWFYVRRVEDELPVQHEATTDPTGTVAIELPVGAIGVRVRSNPGTGSNELPTHDEVRRDITTVRSEATTLVVDLVPRPLATVAFADDVRQAWLVTQAGRYRVVRDAASNTARVPIPAQGPFAFVVDTDRAPQERLFAFPAPPDGTIALRGFPPTRVVATVQDADGRALGVRARLAPRGEMQPAHEPETLAWREFADGQVALPATEVGRAWLHVVPLRPGHRQLVVPVVLPPRGDEAYAALGTLALAQAATPPLRMLRADGTPAQGMVVLQRDGVSMRGALDADGAFEGLLPRPGDVVTWTPDAPPDAAGTPAATAASTAADARAGSLAVRMRLAGPGPWTLREGRGSVRFELRDDRGFALQDGMLWCGLDTFAVRDVFELHGLDDAPHEFVVGATGCDGARVTLQLAPGERRTLRIVLRRRS